MSRRRIRSLKPEFFEDEKVCAISRDARLVTIGLITCADDRGRMHYKPLAILGDIFPEEAVALAKLKAWLSEIVEIGLALIYKVAANEYLWLPQFLRHQVINRPTESILPPHPQDPWAQMPIKDALKAAKLTDELPEASRSDHPHIQESSSHTRGSDPFPSVPISSQSKGRLTREIVDGAITILSARWTTVEEAAIENSAAMYPEVDLLQGARLAVTWASDPSWEIDSPGATLRAAMRKLDSEKPEQGEQSEEDRRLEWLAAGA